MDGGESEAEPATPYEGGGKPEGVPQRAHAPEGVFVGGDDGVGRAGDVWGRPGCYRGEQEAGAEVYGHRGQGEGF